MSRTVNVSERVPRVSIEQEVCYSRRPFSDRFRPQQFMRVWSLPKVFHTCGKNCGKSRPCADPGRFRPEKSMFLASHRPESLKNRGFRQAKGQRIEPLGRPPRSHRDEGEPSQPAHLVPAEPVPPGTSNV